MLRNLIVLFAALATLQTV